MRRIDGVINKIRRYDPYKPERMVFDCTRVEMFRIINTALASQVYVDNIEKRNPMPVTPVEQEQMKIDFGYCLDRLIFSSIWE